MAILWPFYGHFGHFGHFGLTQYGPEYGIHWCLWKDQEKCSFYLKPKYNNKNNLIFMGFNSIEINLVNFTNHDPPISIRNYLQGHKSDKVITGGYMASFRLPHSTVYSDLTVAKLY